MVSVKRLLSAVSVLCASVVVSSQGRPSVIDQTSPSAEPPVSFSWAVGGPSGQLLAQTVTVGTAGRLRAIRVPLGCESGRLILEIRDVGPDGRPGTTYHLEVFDAREFDAPVTNELRTLRLHGRPLRFESGDRFSFVLSNPTGSCGLWPASEGDVYAAGSAWFIAAPNQPGVWVPLMPPGDLAFETVVHGAGPRPRFHHRVGRRS